MHNIMHEMHSHHQRDGSETGIMRALQKNGHKLTRQRQVILEVFLKMDGHPSPEEIHKEIRRKGYRLSLATIYRTLKMLLEAGFVRKLEFGDGQSRYERQKEGNQHLHMICKCCGQTLEAPAMDVDWLFEELAEKHAFVLHSYTTYLYGLCNACISASSKKAITQKKG